MRRIVPMGGRNATIHLIDSSCEGVSTRRRPLAIWRTAPTAVAIAIVRAHPGWLIAVDLSRTINEKAGVVLNVLSAITKTVRILGVDAVDWHPDALEQMTLIVHAGKHDSALGRTQVAHTSDMNRRAYSVEVLEGAGSRPAADEPWYRRRLRSAHTHRS